MTPSTDPASAGSERLTDWLLRGLTVLVTITLAACVLFLGWRWLGPQAANTADIALTAVNRPAPNLNNPDASDASGDEVLVKPDQMYRCEGGGQVSFSDRPCTEGKARVMELPAEQ